MWTVFIEAFTLTKWMSFDLLLLVVMFSYLFFPPRETHVNQRTEHGHYLLSVSQQFHTEMVGSVVSKQVGWGFNSIYETCGFLHFLLESVWDSSLQAKHKLIGFFKSPPGVCVCVCSCSSYILRTKLLIVLAK